MTATIGFILLTHSKSQQIQRLVNRLNMMFDRPPIACHHDFSQCPLSIEDFPQNVSFVRPHLKTEWGDFSIVEITVRALEQLYAIANPDWWIVLSGADYPIKPAAQILSDLEQGGYDVHIDCKLIDPNVLPTDWHREMRNRYYTRWIRVPSFIQLRSKLRRTRLKPRALLKPFLPFSAELRCYAGLHWFSANRRAAETILEFHQTKPKLAAHYRHVMFPEESYFQVILANAPNIKINPNNWRYTDWSAGGSHPKLFQLDDLPKLLASSAHFARKFDPNIDDRILNELDAIVLSSDTSQNY